MKKAANKQSEKTAVRWGKHPIRVRVKDAGFASVAQLARMIPCSRRSLYEAMERPQRFSRVIRRMEELLNA